MGGWIAVLLLAAVQGVTEFLPISSSGHLSLGHALLGHADAPVLFDIILHAGTLVAVVAFYWRDLRLLLQDTFAGLAAWPREGRDALRERPGFSLALLVVCATVPTALIGLFLKDSVESVLREPTSVASMLLLNGVLLWSSRYASGHEQGHDADTALDHGLSLKLALIIGLLQGLAVTPGISRSGITIIGALWLGVAGEQAARFSFLLSIPAILGALVLKIGDVGGSQEVALAPMLVGAAVAAVVGLLSLVFLVRLLRDTRFHHFAWYCWAVGGAVLIAQQM